MQETATELPKRLPKGWRWVRLGEVCDEHTGVRDPKSEPDEEFLYVDISSVDTSCKLIVQPKPLLGKDAPSRARQVIQENDVIVATTRPNLNAVALVPLEYNNQICSTGFCVLRATKQILPDFVFLFVRHESFVEALSDLVKGALYPAVSDKQVKAQIIPLPPLPEQRRIAALLNEQMAGVERARKAAEERLAAVNALPAAYLRAVFPEYGQPLPKGWRWVRLGEVLSRQSIRTRKLKTHEYLAQGRLAVVDQGQKIIVGYTDDITARANVALPAIIFGDHTKIVKYIDFDFAVGADGVVVLQARTAADSRFLFHVLSHIQLPDMGYGRHYQFLSGCEIPLPPLPEQRRIAALLNEQMAGVERARKAAEGELAAINALPAALLRRAFSGEL